MRHVLTGTLSAAALGAALIFGTAPASAQVAGPGGAAALSGATDMTTQVQYRRGWRGNRGWSGNRAWRGNRGWRGGRYYRRGPGIGLGLGLATGAIIGGALAAQAAAPYGNADAYCASRFRSYDPASGTYLGYDGLRHPCP